MKMCDIWEFNSKSVLLEFYCVWRIVAYNEHLNVIIFMAKTITNGSYFHFRYISFTNERNLDLYAGKL